MKSLIAEQCGCDRISDWNIRSLQQSGERPMTQTEPTHDLPQQIKLEFCQVEASPDEDTRRIEIGESGMITSGDGLCVVEIQNMEGDAIATFRLKETLRWLEQNNYRYVTGTNGMYRRISKWELDWTWAQPSPESVAG
jgi:hypothetical protein